MSSLTAREIPEGCQAGDHAGNREGENSEERVCLRRHKGKDLLSSLVLRFHVICAVSLLTSVCVSPEKRGVLSTPSADEEQTLGQA